MSGNEFSRAVRVDTLGRTARDIEIEADAGERAALAKRFELVEIGFLSARLSLRRDEVQIVASGELRAEVVQSCVATDQPVPASIEEPFQILFRPQPTEIVEGEEVELGEEEMDVAFYDGASIDVGEAVAETLALALDPFPRAPDADESLKAAGIKEPGEVGPFAGLAALKDKLGGS